MKHRLLLISLAWVGWLGASAHIPSFWSEHFATGLPGGWQTFDLSPGNVTWEYCADYIECPPASFDFITCHAPRFESPTFRNGYVFVNSFKHGNLPAPHQAVLQAPSVDCSDKSRVVIRFYTYIHALNFNPRQNALLQVRAGGGDWVNFTVFPDLDINVVERRESWNPRPAIIEITEVAAGQPDVEIRWVWKGNAELFWALDDVELFDGWPLDELVVWGQEPGQGDFSAGLGAWTVTNLVDTCRWVWAPKGLVYFPDANPRADFWPCSPTSYNGVAMINPTWCIPLGGPSPFTYSELISPVIDLSDVPPNQRLTLAFFQAFMKGNEMTTGFPLSSVMLSTDGGQTWSDTLAVNTLVPFQKPLCGELRLPLPTGVAGSAQFRFKFVWSGSSFFWVLDDVRVMRSYDTDLAIDAGFTATAPEFSTPLSQIMPLHFAADVVNNGNLPAEETMLYVRVFPLGSESAVFEDSLALGLLQPGQSVSTAIFPHAFTPPAQEATYEIAYTLQAANDDAYPADNEHRHQFSLRQNVFAKDAGDCSINGYFTPAEDIRYEVGNCYFVPRGKGYCAKELEFAFRDAAALEGATLAIRFYQWKNGANSGDVNNDTLASPDEYTLLSFNNYHVSGLENGALIRVPLNFEGHCVPLEDSSWYFATVAYEEPVFVGGQQVPFFIAASEEVDYTATFWLSYQTGPPRFASVLRTGTEQAFRANAWGLRRIPLARLFIDKSTPAGEQSRIIRPLRLFPNPVGDVLHVAWPQGDLLQPAWLEIFDSAGRLVLRRSLDDENVSQLSIPVEPLHHGYHTLRLISRNAVHVGAFIVRH